MENNNDHPFETSSTEKTASDASQSGQSFKQAPAQDATMNQPTMNGAPRMNNMPPQNGNPYTNGNPYMNGNPNMNGAPYMNSNPNGMPPMNQQPNYNYNGYNPNGGFQPKPTNGYAVASLVVGIISLPLAFCYGVGGVIAGIIAIVLACISRETKPDGTKEKLTGLAVGGLVTGIFSIILGIIIFCLIIFAISAYDGLPRYSIEYNHRLLQTILFK